MRTPTLRSCTALPAKGVRGNLPPLSAAASHFCRSRAQEDEEPEDEDVAAVCIELTTCEDLYHVGDGTLRTQAHAIAILLRARGFLPRELDIDGTAMRAIAAVVANGVASTVVADKGPHGKDMLAALGIDSSTALATKFRTSHQQISKYEKLLSEAGYSCSGNASTCWHFCSCFGWESVAGPGLCSGCPCPRCAVTHHKECGTKGGVLLRTAARAASAILPRSIARNRLGVGATYGMPGAWASQEAHFQHLRHMSSQCQTVEDFATYVKREPAMESSRPTGETPEERRRRLMAKFRRVRAEFTEGTVAKVLPILRKEMTWTQVPLYPPAAQRAVLRAGMQGHVDRGIRGVRSAPFLALPLNVQPAAVEAALKFQPCGHLFAPHLVNVDGTASEYPFVLTWFMDAAPNASPWDGANVDMEDEPYDLHDETLTAIDNYFDDGPDYPY